MEPRQVDTESIARRNAVSIFLNALDAASKSSRIYAYEAGQATYESVLGNTIYTLENALKHIDEIELLIKPFEIVFERKVVYENKDKKHSLCFKIYGDGIRMIAFQKGLQTQDIRKIIEIISTDFSRPDMFDEDIYCLFMENPVPYFEVASSDTIKDILNAEADTRMQMEPFLEKMTQRNVPPQPPKQRKLRSDDLKVLSEFQLKTDQFQRSDEEVKQVVLSLAAPKDEQIREKETLERLMAMGFHFILQRNDLEQIRIGRELVMKIGLLILEGAFFDLYENFLDKLDEIKKQAKVETNDFQKIIDFLFSVDRLPLFSKLLQEYSYQKPIANILCKGPPITVRLAIFLLEKYSGLVKDIGTFILNQLPQEMSWLLDEVIKQPERDCWEQLIHLFSASPSPFFQRFLQALLSTEKQTVRAKVLKLLATIGTVEALQVFDQLLSGNDREERLRAYSCLALGTSKEVLKLLHEHLYSRIFEKLTLAEKVEAYSCLLVVSGERALPWFAELWMKPAPGFLWFRRRKERARRLVLTHVLGKSYPDVLAKLIATTSPKGLNDAIQAAFAKYRKASSKGKTS